MGRCGKRTWARRCTTKTISSFSSALRQKGSPKDLWGIAPHSGKSHLPGLVMKSKQTANGYAMEIALPREMFEMEVLPGALGADYGGGMSMGLSIVVNDRAREKAGRKSSIIWGGTPRNHLDPTKFGTLILLP